MGRFVLGGVAAGRYVIVARRIGYERAAYPITLREGVVDTVHFRLRSQAQVDAEERLKLRVPTAVTPCRPTEEWTEVVHDYVRRTVIGDPEAEGDDDFAVQFRDSLGLYVTDPEDVYLVTEPALCRRAIAGLAHAGRDVFRHTQIYLFRVGSSHYAAYDPESLYDRNHCWDVTFFDSKFAAIVTLC